MQEVDTEVIKELLDCCNTLNEVPKEALDTPFAEVIWPWMAVARSRLEEKVGKQLHLLSAEAKISMELSLFRRWSELCTPSMLFAMEIEKIGFSLHGRTSRERYLHFITKKYLDKDALASFFEEYAELARLITTVHCFWENQAIEFLSRLEQDIPLLAAVFNEGQPLGKVEVLKLDAGDFHHEGRSVFILTFTSEKELLYKPRNLNSVKNFNAYIARLTELGLELPLKTYQVLPRGEYGWEEKVEHKPCLTREEVNAYFKRTGMYLCLLYLLDGTDVHFENIIAAGEHPVFIDLETIFHAHLEDKSKELTEKMIQHSVFSVGLLPCFRFTKTKQKGQDISGLGFEAEDISRSTWENIHTDEMVSITQRVPHKHTNQVVFNHVTVKAKDYVDDILSGFNAMYRFIQEKQPFLVAEGWYSLMAKDPVRILLRATRFYGYILQQLYEPKALLNSDFREEILSKLSKSYGQESKRPESLDAEERKSLLQGDIPCFNTFPSSTDLFSKQNLIANDCLEKPAIESVMARFKSMSETDRNLQETFIRAAFYAKSTSIHDVKDNRISFNKHNPAASDIPNDEEVLAYAESLANELRKRAYQSEDGALGWINLEPNLVTDQYQLTPLSDSLYSGRGGIALFFAALSCLTKNKKWEEESLNSLKGLRTIIQNGKGKQLLATFGIGGMSGVGGTIYTLFQIGRLLNLPYLIQDAKKLVDCIDETHIQQDVHYDVIFGNAGLILVLLSFYQYQPEPHFLKLATLCGDYICSKADDLLEEKSNQLLLGLSHGAAGISYALFKLASLTNNAYYSQKAQTFLAYERSYFSKEHQNWPRLSQNTYSCSWCHGATGIGFARLASLPFFQDSLIAQEIEIALKTNEANIHAGALNLCCGSLGRLEFLIEASNRKQTIRDSIGSIFHQLKHAPAEDFDNPGFMQGKAGLGYTLLRLIDKEHSLPQVLLLQ